MPNIESVLDAIVDAIADRLLEKLATYMPAKIRLVDVRGAGVLRVLGGDDPAESLTR